MLSASLPVNVSTSPMLSMLSWNASWKSRFRSSRMSCRALSFSRLLLERRRVGPCGASVDPTIFTFDETEKTLVRTGALSALVLPVLVSSSFFL